METLSDKPATPVSTPLTSVEKLERETLLEEIRRNLIRNPKLELRLEDVLPEKVLQFSNVELKNIIRNINIQKRDKNSLLNAKNLIQGLNTMTEFLSESQLTIETAIGDEDLQKDIDELVHDYFGEMPIYARILGKFATHVAYKEKKTGAPQAATQKGK